MAKRLMFICVAIVLMSLSFMAISERVAAEEAYELIQWNKPVPMVERITAKDYILPEGWKEATEGVTQITFLNSGGMAYDPATMMNMMRFEELTGIKVEAVPVNPTLAYSKSLSILVAKDPGVDLVLLDNSELEVSGLAAGGWLFPVDVLWTPEEELLKHYTSALTFNKWDGHWYSSNITLLSTLSFYRPSLLEKVGIDHAPSSWEDLKNSIRKTNEYMQKELGSSYYGMTMQGASVNIFNNIRDTYWSMKEGINKIYRDGKYHFDDPDYIKAFDWWANAVREGVATKDVVNYSYAEAGESFGTGKAFYGMIISAFAMRFPVDFPIGEDFDTFGPIKWQESDPDSYGSGSVTGNALGINVYIDSKQKAAALLFLDFLRSREATRNEVVVEGNESQYLGNYTNPDVVNEVDWDLADKAAAALEIASPKRVKDISSKATRLANLQGAEGFAYPPSFREILTKHQEEFAKAALGEITSEEACKNVQDFASIFETSR